MNFSAELGRLIIEARIERMRQQAEADSHEEGQASANSTNQISQLLTEDNHRENPKEKPASRNAG